MRQAIAQSVVVGTILASGIIPNTATIAHAQNTQNKNTEQKKMPERESSLTGCVDQRDELFVLVNDRDLKVIANLDAVGFPVEGFAKHVGEKVIVRGISTQGDTRPVFKVRTIETVSDTCAPQATEKGKK
jgi:hypothetical protein